MSSAMPYHIMIIAAQHDIMTAVLCLMAKAFMTVGLTVGDMTLSNHFLTIKGRS